MDYFMSCHAVFDLLQLNFYLERLVAHGALPSRFCPESICKRTWRFRCCFYLVLQLGPELLVCWERLKPQREREREIKGAHALVWVGEVFLRLQAFLASCLMLIVTEANKVWN